MAPDELSFTTFNKKQLQKNEESYQYHELEKMRLSLEMYKIKRKS